MRWALFMICQIHVIRQRVNHRSAATNCWWLVGQPEATLCESTSPRDLEEPRPLRWLGVRIINVGHDFPFYARLLFPNARVLSICYCGLAVFVDGLKDKSTSFVGQISGVGNFHFGRAPLKRSWRGKIFLP